MAMARYNGTVGAIRYGGIKIYATWGDFVRIFPAATHIFMVDLYQNEDEPVVTAHGARVHMSVETTGDVGGFAEMAVGMTWKAGAVQHQYRPKDGTWTSQWPPGNAPVGQVAAIRRFENEGIVRPETFVVAGEGTTFYAGLRLRGAGPLPEIKLAALLNVDALAGTPEPTLEEFEVVMTSLTVVDLDLVPELGIPGPI